MKKAKMNLSMILNLNLGNDAQNYRSAELFRMIAIKLHNDNRHNISIFNCFKTQNSWENGDFIMTKVNGLGD